MEPSIHSDTHWTTVGRVLRGHPSGSRTPVQCLEDGALAVAALLDGECDPAATRRRLDALALSSTRTMVQSGSSRGLPGEDALDLTRILFGVGGPLRGDRLTYSVPENSSVAAVLERGRGIPLTLSIIALCMADRMDISLVGLNRPGHFVLAVPRAGVVVDPFDGGRIGTMSVAEVKVALAGGARPETMLSRMLANMAASFDTVGHRLTGRYLLARARAEHDRDAEASGSAVALAEALGRPDVAARLITRFDLDRGTSTGFGEARRRRLTAQMN